MPSIKDKGRTLQLVNKGIETTRGGRTLLTQANEFFTHFNKASTIDPGLTLTNVNAVTAATYGTGLGGTAVITSDDVAAVVGCLGTQLLWQCDRQPTDQPLVFESKWQPGATITATEYWAGFDDTITPGDAYAISATSTFTTSEPDDAAVMGYTATATSGAAFTTGGNEIIAVNSIATANSIVGKTGTVFAASTYYTTRIELDASGNAAFFLNGQFKLSKPAAVTPTVPLCGFVEAIPRTTTAAVMTVDYFYVGGV